VTDPLAFNARPPLLAIPGVEISARRGKVGYHVVSIGVRSMPIAHDQDPQATTDAVNAAGGLCFIAHPYWHDHTFSLNSTTQKGDLSWNSIFGDPTVVR
jgi:predicted metal-dependent phosphoesterase TrpH